MGLSTSPESAKAVLDKRVASISVQGPSEYIYPGCCLELRILISLDSLITIITSYAYS
jgi:hypothetical protein